MRKFGTFGGVFTPSILTILGVIMYLRLPWIVGQAGLWVTLGIIVVAHIISVTTGLSVASIATDKKVKVGGNYYIISRSLGLSIGGTLGIALFIGLSFSVSLYIIGFIESFLPVWDIAVTTNSIRIYGTLALVVVGTVILISTSLAIKTQYVIMGAIVFSLFSIIWGRPEISSEAPVLFPADDSVPLMVLFGIFFPAVTGFTAGVQMSGDLRDPKKSIPIGTVASIGVGFLVYVGLTFFISYRLPVAMLSDSPTVLVDSSRYAWMVFAGIWGATLSSAMGSLLGAPRILQATSLDRITPQFFAKGYGPGNEPRNALIMTFLIAEAGILIGELNIIAAIISVFFITTYGFINLSCAIETWASTDFRPLFRIPTWVSVLGAVACFMVMLQLDVVSFIGASILLGLLYLYLVRRELTLESGDTWEGVWSSIIRTGLYRLSRTVTHARNWRPNIVLFSGGTEARPHLIEFGKWIVHKRGILSNFDLVETKQGKGVFPKSEQTVQTKEGESFMGVFSRRLSCRDIYEGMETIGQVYGFSGVDPNTVMMGWARNSNDPLKFAHMTRHFAELDFNILMLDYDKERGFGDYKQIDIWWRGGNNNATLSLTILKFLLASDTWRTADARILILVEDSARVNTAYANMNQILEEQRLPATVKVINNGIERRPFRETIKVESANADLIMLGLPVVSEKNASQFIEQVNSIVGDLGSTLLVYASTFFDSLIVGVDTERPAMETSEADNKDWESLALQLPALEFPRTSDDEEVVDEVLRTSLLGVTDPGEAAFSQFHRETLEQIHLQESEILETLESLLEHSFSSLEKALAEMVLPRRRKAVNRVISEFLFQTRRHMESVSDAASEEHQTLFRCGIEELIDTLKELSEKTRESLGAVVHPERLQPNEHDSVSLRKLKGRLLKSGTSDEPIRVQVPLQQIVRHHFTLQLPGKVLKHLETSGLHAYRNQVDVQKWLNTARDALVKIERSSLRGELRVEDVKQERLQLENQIALLKFQSEQWILNHRFKFIEMFRLTMQEITEVACRIDAAGFVKSAYRSKRKPGITVPALLDVPAHWVDNIQLVANLTILDLALMQFKHRLNQILRKTKMSIDQHIEGVVLAGLTNLEEELRSMDTHSTNGTPHKIRTSVGLIDEFDEQRRLKSLIADVYAAVNELPETTRIISEASNQNIADQQFRLVETQVLHARRLVDYLVENQVTTPIQKQLSGLPEHIQKTITTTEDIIRLIEFNQPSLEGGDGHADPDMQAINELVESALARITNESTILKTQRDAFEMLVRKLYADIDDKLNPYFLMKSAGKLDQYYRSEERRRMRSGVLTRWEKLKSDLNGFWIQLLYHRSRSVLLARRLGEGKEDTIASPESVLQFAARAMPNQAVIAQLPFYYRQLFSGKQQIGGEFWIRQREQIAKAEAAIEHYRKGFTGAILVTGEPNSGKSSFCRHVVKHSFDTNRIFNLYAPEDGSTEPQRFKEQLEDLLKVRGDYDQIFRFLPQNSVIIIHDLELWWERTAEGLRVVREIGNLINRYGQRSLFIVNVNSHSFRFLNRMYPLNDHFISRITINPFDSDEIRQAILLRHRSSGIKFDLAQQDEESISGLRLARLFYKHFQFSDGNIGTALLSWLSHIESVAGERITIRQPLLPDLACLQHLESEQQVWIQQFVLHKQLTVPGMVRIFNAEEEVVTDIVHRLKRMGLIIETSTQIYALNPYLQNFIIQKLRANAYL